MDASIILIVGLVIPLSEIVIVSPNKMNLLHTCLPKNELAASNLCRQVEKDEVSEIFLFSVLLQSLLQMQNHIFPAHLC